MRARVEKVDILSYTLSNGGITSGSASDTTQGRHIPGQICYAISEMIKSNQDTAHDLNFISFLSNF